MSNSRSYIRESDVFQLMGNPQEILLGKVYLIRLGRDISQMPTLEQYSRYGMSKKAKRLPHPPNEE